MGTKSYTYENHYEKQKESILKSAENLFNKHGIDGVSMTKIAKEANINRSTLYQYFDCKEKIIFQIYSHYYLKFDNLFKKKLNSKTLTTYEKFEAFFEISMQMYLSCSDYYRFLSYFLRNINDNYSDNQLIEKFYLESNYKTGAFTAPFLENFLDGSVKDTLDPVSTTIAICHGTNGLLIYYANMFNHINYQYKINIDTILKESFNSWLQYISKE